MKEISVDFLKEKYNYWLARSKKADEFFNNSTVDESLKYVKAYNEITRNLSVIMEVIEKKLGRKLTDEEKFNGF
ncbi:hypothetical protein [Clostridium sp.]|uniref:hypothetical protein n=1 Tax=Clostridium sp. TaxID=1506 RepID=UPI001B657A9F|nr:hypothetical protein [Clostridium sp.]MBP3916613.1 hypothetical protein [Clostridium sp.]